jgi:hypothetical protein
VFKCFYSWWWASPSYSYILSSDCNDTLIVGEKSRMNIRAMKTNLIHFELISRLKINFHKSLLRVRRDYSHPFSFSFIRYVCLVYVHPNFFLEFIYKTLLIKTQEIKKNVLALDQDQSMKDPWSICVSYTNNTTN